MGSCFILRWMLRNSDNYRSDTGSLVAADELASLGKWHIHLITCVLTSRFDLTSVIVEKVEGSVESAMQRILNESEGGGERECLIQWEDGSTR